MIRMIQVSSSDNAKSYYTDGLSKGDYYLDDQELAGKIKGKLAERLGISGDADKDIFYALCDNLDPKTGEQLTPRMKENRIVGYDINFHCPKSVSIVHALSKDTHVLDAFEEAVNETMADIESDAKTRVRTNGRDEDRDTEELVWGQFIHQTARPADKLAPDPHLHAHCIVFNATYDPDEERIKAARFRYIKRDMPYYQAMFHKRLSDRLIDLGYDIQRTKKSFEIAGVPARITKHFSKRTDEIGRFAKEKGITDPKELDQLGARTRSKKQKGYTMTDLKAEWRRQIRELGNSGDGEGSEAVRFAPKKDKERYSAKECIDHAITHEFERASVKQDRKLLAAAYRHSIGDEQTKVGTIDEAFEADERIIRVKENTEMLCTTHEILAEERYMVKIARREQGKLLPLYKKLPKIRAQDDQRNAIEHILSTTDRISIVRGGAGTGKTTLMKEAVEHLENAGKKVSVVAPIAKTTREVLQGDGFENAQTVSKLLNDKQLQNDLKNQVLWVDEAGLLSNKDMISLIELASTKNARLILGGDTRQHTAVQRGDALRILNKVGKIKAAEVNKIFRQQNDLYRQTVQFLSDGKVKDAFHNLDKMGAIAEIDKENPQQGIVGDYLSSVKSGHSSLVIAPTHQEGELVTKAVRTALKAEGLIDQQDVKTRRLTALNFTAAQKTDWRNIEKGQIIQFSQNGVGIKRGSQWKVVESTERDIIIANEEQKQLSLPVHRAEHYDVFAEETIDLAKGDSIRITRNGIDRHKDVMSNGQIFKVGQIHDNGDIEVENSKTQSSHRLPKDYGHIAHAHCITSHASQGQTVDRVFVSVPASSFGATNLKQMYVSVSRGRHGARIYTDDKEALIQQASKAGDRESAIELVAKHSDDDTVRHQLREQMARNNVTEKEPVRAPFERPKSRSRGYEPGI